ncbi:hypothetical protein F511_23993 [Dorcoceras hygrometricum]|uniref:Uncharacterized protein n=1 Tax=Dorcoceras hygrometricum TaxID=472368 RepID=A0A2Z7CQ92_9LAMI|nr:hypothetical protein F511_23993 [Dorcoceras hygrometricum]
MVKRLETSPHDPLGISDSACKNQLVMVSVQYGPFNTNIPIRSTTIGKSRVARDPITMQTSRRSNSDIACLTSALEEIGRCSSSNSEETPKLVGQRTSKLERSGAHRNEVFKCRAEYKCGDQVQCPMGKSAREAIKEKSTSRSREGRTNEVERVLCKCRTETEKCTTHSCARRKFAYSVAAGVQAGSMLRCELMH